tara:strand:- start:175 stop:417 length:243 start_codon:yes stop_codon:yes gene_type:complete
MQKVVSLPRCLEKRERVGYSYVKPTVVLLTAKSLTVFYNHLTIRENSRGGVLAFLLSLYGTMPLIRLGRRLTLASAVSRN